MKRKAMLGSPTMRTLYNMTFTSIFVLLSPYYFLRIRRQGDWVRGFRAIRLESISRIKRNPLKLVALVLLLHSVPIAAAEPEAASTEKVYRDYTEAYQKATQLYEKSARESQTSAFFSWGILGIVMGCALMLTAKTRRDYKAYTDRALEIARANQKLLEEIRDLLKNART